MILFCFVLNLPLIVAARSWSLLVASRSWSLKLCENDSKITDTMSKPPKMTVIRIFNLKPKALKTSPEI